eukprot:jgi/Botrbrau1/1167/Bobra.0162s0055.1
MAYQAPRPRTLTDAISGAGTSAALFGANNGPTISRKQLLDAVTTLANTLRASGIKPGDAVTLVDTNTIDFVIAFLAVTAARAIAAPLNSSYTQDEFKFYLEDVRSKLVLVPVRGIKLAEAAAAQTGVPVADVALLQTAGGFQPQLRARAGAFRVQPAGPTAGPANTDGAQPDDVALFLHTSGTTGRPKGVPLSHGNLAASLSNIAQTYELTPADRSLLVMPLFHVHGLMAGLLAPLAAGASVIIPEEGRFSASTFWRDAVAFQATFYTAVPTMHQILLGRAATDYPAGNPPPLRFIRSCSSALAPATLHKLEATFKAPVLEAYAMTEASHQMTSNPLPKNGPHKPGTVGRPQGSVQLAILDANNQVLPPGKIGEVSIRGPNVTKGYFENPKANAEAFAGGWFHTGDQGFLDEDGFVTLTGRIKELINRGGEKISPIEVDGALLSHPAVAEAVSFGAPDEKYGEEVAAAIVLGKNAPPPSDTLKQDIRNHVASTLSKFKVPQQIFFTDTLPKTATGKIQRRFMVEYFIKGKKGEAPAAPPAPASAGALPVNGYSVVAATLARLNVRHIYGVIGIPVTELASSAQAAGIRYIGFRNEQAAGYAAAASGFLTGVPGVLLTVSGPGAINGIGGLAHAAVNTWPLLQISGSAEQNEIGKGSFQELDQVQAVRQYCKYAGRATSIRDIGPIITAAVKATVAGRPGAAYVDIPSDVLMAPGSPADALAPQVTPIPPVPPLPVSRSFPPPDVADVKAAVDVLRSALRPLVVIGKGAAYSQADEALRALIDGTGLPFLATSMGRGVVPDSHPHNVNAARSLALAKADVAIIFGARLNWQLHFGEPPKWSSGVKFILVDVEPSERDASKAAVVLRGDAAVVAAVLAASLGGGSGLQSSPALQAWRSSLSLKAKAAAEKLEKKLEATTYPLDYYTAMRVIRDGLLAVRPHPVVVSEGANTMDQARVILGPVEEGRLRIDAGTWGTMGLGLASAIAAAVVRPDRLVVAVEGDSAFGFSGMELETIVRYNLAVVVIVFNNSGIYGGDRRVEPLIEAAEKGAKLAGFGQDPPPTAFVPKAGYHEIATAFGGEGYEVESAAQLATAVRIAFSSRKPALINVLLDPMAGVESGNVHAFNAPKSNL